MREDGFVIECGADSFISDKPWALELARRLGLEGELIPTTSEFRRTMVVCRGRLTEIPAGFQLLAPVDLMPIMKSPILSLRGKLRLLLEPILPRRAAPEDESLAAFVTRRMGREVLDRLAQPLAGRHLHRRPGGTQYRGHAAAFCRTRKPLRQRHPRAEGGAEKNRRTPGERRALGPVPELQRRDADYRRRAARPARRDASGWIPACNRCSRPQAARNGAWR